MANLVAGQNTLNAQMTVATMASVSGIVSDASGPLNGVEVRVGNPALAQTINAFTGADGRYAFTPVFTPELGPWTITFLKLGYQTITRTGVTLVVGNNTQNATMVVVPPSLPLTYISAYASEYHPTWQPPPYYWAGVIYVLTVHNPHSVRVTKNLYNWQKTYSGPNISEGPTGFVASITLAPGETNEFEWYIELGNLAVISGYRTDVWFVDDDGQLTPVLRG